MKNCRFLRSWIQDQVEMPCQSRHPLKWGDPEWDRKEKQVRLTDIQERKEMKEGRNEGEKEKKRGGERRKERRA